MATTKNIQSVERAFAILELYQRAGCAEYSLKEIAAALELNKSTAFGLINTLADLGYLWQNAENQKYALGLKLLSLSSTVKAQSILIQAIHPYLEQVSRKYGETVHCAVACQGGVIYIDKVEAVGSISINTQIGMRNELHCTGVGKCLLAYLPPAEQEQIYRGELRTRTYNTITNAERLRAEVSRIRKQGYAVDNEEIALGLRCLAVPVFSAPEQVACAVSVSGMAARIEQIGENALASELKWMASAISQKVFGYTYEA
ncbi:MAG: IclR family transcriptional regulator [Eubacteriales bacterium]|nr:IclR family transcriptional regulator [Eubacteriales bacterium]